MCWVCCKRCECCLGRAQSPLMQELGPVMGTACDAKMCRHVLRNKFVPHIYANDTPLLVLSPHRGHGLQGHGLLLEWVTATCVSKPGCCC